MWVAGGQADEALSGVMDQAGGGLEQGTQGDGGGLGQLLVVVEGEVGGYWWGFSMRQIETSRTIVFDTPRYARSFFEALVADNLDVGRPDTVELVFGRGFINGPQTGHPANIQTKVVTRGVDVTINAFYRHSRLKQYLKDGRALRVETVINSPTDLRVGHRLVNLDELQGKARAINARLFSRTVGRSPVRPSAVPC